MSIQGSKRKRNATSKPKKRQKVGEAPLQIVNEQDLAWTEVALPDQLEDAEGFYGLEEVDDVEVIRTETGNGVKFRTKASKSDPATSTSTPAPTDTSTQTVDEESEWSGFGDDSPLENDVPKKKQSRQRSGEETQQISKGILKKNHDNSTFSTPNKDSGFALLSEEMPDADIDVSAWGELGLSAEVLSGITNVGFSRPTSIQEACIPEILGGHDVIGKASTGSGKTLAYGIPILHNCLSIPSSPTALILSPTRELAHQISKHLSTLFEGVSDPPRIATVTGGLSIQKQERQLANANVVIATPGRMWEVIDNSHGLIDQMKKLRMLVVDEADRLLSEGHFQEVGKILEALDKEIIEEGDEVGKKTQPSARTKRQVLVFSATFHKGLQQRLAGKLKAGEMLNNQQSMEYLLKKLPFREKPKFIDVNPASQMVETLKEGVVECGAMEKDLYLYTILLQNSSKRTLVFTNSISATKRIASFLQNLKLPSHALHSSMEQKARLRSIERFTASAGSTLIATDVAARGLDIKGIGLIVHYHVPRTADMYVHRSGRTARAETTGKSILLCSPDETAGVTRLIAKVHSSSSESDGKSSRSSLVPVEIDRQLINRLSPRVKLSQKITDATLAKEKAATRDDWIHKAAEELGVDYDSDEFAADAARGTRGRGGGKDRIKNSKNVLSKAEISDMRAQLKDLLSKRVNMGVSEKYLAGGGLDVNQLLMEKDNGQFLGRVDAINF
ncbi:putative atp-dependent rna helicase mak5 [Phaeomoniella chlamydospora]|uniref:ATP-dependent RNA helicase n=1 Tax=Phaeomoniella chlamydospora TaxID=158046 RepID=A0A0G2DV30_PHACM|nr:putative atp-dependent rna helicase mak5 [Phaeomoniella chlamydospora]